MDCTPGAVQGVCEEHATCLAERSNPQLAGCKMVTAGRELNSSTRRKGPGPKSHVSNKSLLKSNAYRDSEMKSPQTTAMSWGSHQRMCPGWERGAAPVISNPTSNQSTDTLSKTPANSNFDGLQKGRGSRDQVHIQRPQQPGADDQTYLRDLSHYGRMKEFMTSPHLGLQGS